MGIGSQIKSLRIARGFTQEQLAKALYVSRQTILNWEQGRTTPDAQSLLLLSALYGVTIDTLMKGDVQAMDDILNARSGLSCKTLAIGVGIGIVGSVLLAMPLGSVLDQLGYALALTPTLTAIASMALVAKSSHPAAPIDVLRAGLERSTSFTLTCSNRRNELNATATDTEGNILFRINRTGNVPRGQNWGVTEESGDCIATVGYRSIAVGNPCPYIKAKVEGLGTIKMEKTVGMATDFKSIWKLSGAGIGIEGDWLGDEVTFTRDGTPLVHVEATATTQDAEYVYRLEVSNGLLCGAAVTLAFMLALMRDLERPVI